MSDEESFGSPVGSIRWQQQQRRRASLGPRVLLSPTSQNPRHILGSNNDELERAQLRAARAAANRRKSVVLARPLSLGEDAGASLDVLGREQVLELFQNCIKLASENKINQKNTWDLGLIDHLSEIVRVEPNVDAETNFQKASCTLEAGVKIYSMRVDSVHSEAYKVLGGINRVGKDDDDKENVAEDENINPLEENHVPKKDLGKKMSPETTLESSFEALNVKKFDVAFTVDPLYHQTSKQFDEGGVKGLLLSNLGVYGSCKVLFDSLEVPRKCMTSDRTTERSDIIDLSFVKEPLEEMINGVRSARDISPTLGEIINLFDENNKRPPNLAYEPMPTVEADMDANHDQSECEAQVHYDEQWSYDHDEQSGVIDDDASYVNPSFTSHQEENYDDMYQESGKDDRTEKIAGFLSLGLGFSSKANAWAGPEYWKYQKVKVSEDDSVATRLVKEKKTKNRKQSASAINFTKSLDMPPKDIFAPPKNPKSLLLSANQVPSNVTLPEDVHYQPENLVKLFLVPNTLCTGKKARKTNDDFKQQHFSHDSMGDWDDEGAVNDYFDDGDIPADCDNLGDLVSQPRQVNKIEIEYDKSSKQVDVHALKGVLWKHIRDSIDEEDMECSTAVSFRQVCSNLLSGSSESVSKDVSPHLCFICLLHLANEHCLRICHKPTFDELDIYFTEPTKL